MSPIDLPDSHFMTCRKKPVYSRRKKYSQESGTPFAQAPGGPREEETQGALDAGRARKPAKKRRGPANGKEVEAEVRHTPGIKSGDLGDRLAELAHLIIAELPGKLAEANAGQLARSLGIVIDRMLVLKGQPNQITQNQMLTEEERLRRIADILESGTRAPQLEPRIEGR